MTSLMDDAVQFSIETGIRIAIRMGECGRGEGEWMNVE